MIKNYNIYMWTYNIKKLKQKDAVVFIIFKKRTDCENEFSFKVKD